MTTKLLTDWLVIGTSGTTADRREITAQELIEAAETYDKDVYLACINSNHKLDEFGNFGFIDAVRTRRDKDNKVLLEARLCPNNRLIAMNKNGQRQRFSLELVANFADTGKTYLTGLAMTDNPACLGLSRMNFSREKTIKSNPIEIDLHTDSDEQSFFKKFFNFCRSYDEWKENSSNTPPQTPTPELIQENQAMNAEEKKEFEELKEMTRTCSDELESLKKRFASVQNPEAETSKEEKKEPVITLSSLHEEQKKLYESVHDLTKSLNHALNEKTFEAVEPSAGSADDAQKFVMA